MRLKINCFIMWMYDIKDNLNILQIHFNPVLSFDNFVNLNRIVCVRISYRY